MTDERETVVGIQGKQLRLSNLSKVLYPEVGFTKAQVVDYYVRIAPVLLPHLRDRPLTMKRYPEGVKGQFFYEKNCPVHRPAWVKTSSAWSDSSHRWVHYCLIQDLPTLVWAANLADLELHTSLSLGGELGHPTAVVFDLDPGEPATIVQCCRVGLMLRRVFARFGLECWAKTSGSKGLQVYVALNTVAGYDETKSFAHEVARRLEHFYPELVVANMKKNLRTGKVLVDWSQNDEHKTTVCVYSLRAKERPTVSTPVSWEEVEECWQRRDPGLLVFTAGQVLHRVEELGDLFEPVLTREQRLRATLDRLGEIDLAVLEPEERKKREKHGPGGKRAVAGSRGKTAKRAGKETHAA